MSDGLANLNQNSILQQLSANSPERLANLIRQIKVPMQIIGFTASGGLHTCYFRSWHKIKVVRQKVEQAEIGGLDG
jgi:hypothetical protein